MTRLKRIYRINRMLQDRGIVLRDTFHWHGQQKDTLEADGCYFLEVPYSDNPEKTSLHSSGSVWPDNPVTKRHASTRHSRQYSRVKMARKDIISSRPRIMAREQTLT